MTRFSKVSNKLPEYTPKDIPPLLYGQLCAHEVACKDINTNEKPQTYICLRCGHKFSEDDMFASVREAINQRCYIESDKLSYDEIKELFDEFSKDITQYTGDTYISSRYDVFVFFKGLIEGISYSKA